jgi:hypothetical protein
MFNRSPLARTNTNSIFIIFAVTLTLIITFGCGEVDEIKKDLDVYNCWEDGSSLKLEGKFITPIEGWERTTNKITIQFNTNCPDVYGYGETLSFQEDFDYTLTATSLISFKGTYDDMSHSFKGTVYVDHDTVCEGNCSADWPYSFDYPAVWNGKGTYMKDSIILTGWLDGYGDFKLDKHTYLEEDTYKIVPGLDIWPEGQ